MATRDPRIDAYIRKAAPFAQPILAHLRDVVHAACPDVEETLKWAHPTFMHKGMLCGMAAFKAHCTFGFWRHALLEGELPLCLHFLQDLHDLFSSTTSISSTTLGTPAAPGTASRASRG